MKILHIAYFGRHGIVTGIVEAVINMTECQRKLGHDVRTYIPFRHPMQDGKNIYYIEDIPVERISLSEEELEIDEI